jgi:hypothetical protein
MRATVVPARRVLHVRGAMTSSFAAVAALTVLALSGAPTTAAAATCPNEVLRGVQPHAALLPDCRAYEQVSPTAKNFTDATGTTGYVRASPDGSKVTFYSDLPFPGVVGAGEFLTYLSDRGAGGWGTESLLPPSENGTSPEIFGLSDDLSTTVLASKEPILVSEGATPGRFNAYVHRNGEPGYRLLARGPDAGAVHLNAASPDGERVLFSDPIGSSGEEEPLVPGVPNEAEVPFLYEWINGKLSFVGYLPNGEIPAGGTAAGMELEEHIPDSNENVMSQDGSKIFFTALENHHVYVREPLAERTREVSVGPAEWRGATPSGDATFYIEEGELYRVELGTLSREALTGVGGVIGTLGFSESGRDAYFVSTEDIPGSTHGVSSPVVGASNLYEWHEDEGTKVATITFVAEIARGINSGPSERDWRGWRAQGQVAAFSDARVAPSGNVAVFGSERDLTGQNALGPEEESEANDQIYRYELASNTLACISCTPGGDRPSRFSQLSQPLPSIQASPPAPEPDAFLTRNLSSDGDRVFFETSAPLVPQDVNGVNDVYEWERAGSGSCAAEGPSCLSLISSGTSTDPSYFGDASSTGGDVFFFTRQALVAQDEDDNNDVYDARESGGLGDQGSHAMRPCEGEVCRGPLEPPPPVASLASAGLLTDGNLVATAPPVRPETAAQRRAKLLKAALKACHAHRRSSPRKACEAKARRRYGPAQARKPKKKRSSKRAGNPTAGTKG